MKIFLMYLFLFVFWLQLVARHSLTDTVGLSYLNLVTYLLIICWAITIIRTRKIFQYSNLNSWMLIYALVVLFSVLVKIVLNEVPPISIPAELIKYKGFLILILIYFIIFNIIQDKKTANWVLGGLVLLLIVSSALPILGKLGIIAKSSHLYKIGAHERIASFAEPNQYASFIVLLFPLVLIPFFMKGRLSARLISLGLCVFIIVTLIMTGSRGGILSFFLSMAVYSFYAYKLSVFKLPKMMIFGVLLLVLFATAFLLAPATVRNETLDRFTPSQSGDMTQYSAGRTMIWGKGLELFIKSPLFGHGQDSFLPLMEKNYNIRGNSHNDYLLHLVNQGIIGLVVFVMLFVKIFQHMKYHLNHTKDLWSKCIYITYASGFAGYVFSMFFVNLITPPLIFWFYTAAIYKYSILQLKDEKVPAT